VFLYLSEPSLGGPRGVLLISANNKFRLPPDYSVAIFSRQSSGWQFLNYVVVTNGLPLP
jgi:hypothetical protein